MLSLHECSDPSSLGELKAEYLQGLVAPLDGMWEALTDAASHWEIARGGRRAGYYAANDEGALLRFHVRPDFAEYGRALFDHVVAQDALTRAEVSTIDPACLSLCLEVQRGVTVHTYLYEARSEGPVGDPETGGPDFRPVDAAELDRTVDFEGACLSGGGDMSGWLRGYSEKLIGQGGLFVLCRGDEWLGLGEYRRSDTQERVVDLGMMVAPAHRGRGWGTDILVRLRARAVSEGRRPICSTTVDNVGAQRAITRSGFVSRHRILTVTF